MRNSTYVDSLLACVLCALLSCAVVADDAPKPADERVPGTTKGVIDIKHHERPDDATQLVGREGHTLVPEKGDKTNWTFADGVLTAPSGWDSLITKDAYGDFILHVEFNCNDKGGDNLEANGNSGVYIQERYEVQIQNAFGIKEEDFTASYCGSIYKMKKPDILVAKPAGQWQSFDIVFRAARFEGDKKTENARITVYHNGVLIHDDYEMPRKTGAGAKEGPEKMPLKFQGHNNPVKFRNVWVKPLVLE